MPKRPQVQKGPADVVGNAVHVMRIATGQIEADTPAKLARNSRRTQAIQTKTSQSCALCMRAPLQNWRATIRHPPVRPEPDEPVFHTPWEGRVAALNGFDGREATLTTNPTLAVENGKPVGCVARIAKSTATHAHLSPWIAGLWVDAPHRFKGIGPELIKAACHYAEQTGFAEAFACTSRQRSARFWEWIDRGRT